MCFIQKCTGSVILFPVSAALLQSFRELGTGAFFSFLTWNISFTLLEVSSFATCFCEPCLAFSTAGRCHLDFEFHSFEDQPACFLTSLV